ncbi:MAG: type II toxin-antitoxin system HicB family antitoxin [Leptospirales bacterium]
MEIQYEVIIYWSHRDKCYLAEAPDLPGCLVHGRSYREAAENIVKAMELWLRVAREFKRRIPKPRKRRG